MGSLLRPHTATPGTPLSAGLWLYARYQALTKPLLLLLVFPLARGLADALITSSGRAALSSGD